MAENQVEELVRNAVAQALERQMASLREGLVQEVLREVKSALGGSSQPANSTAALQKAVTAIHAGGTQKEILRALLDSSALYSGREALSVVKQCAAFGCQCTALRSG